MKKIGQSLGWSSQQVTKSRQANERPELFWPSFPIPWALTAQSRLLPESYEPMTRNLALPKHRSAVTFVDFSLQCVECELELEDWYRAKSKLNWNRPKSCSASESLLWALILDLSQRQPKCQFSWRVTTFWHFAETDNLIQVEISWY